MKTIKYPPQKNWAKLCKRPELDSASLNKKVRTILNEVNTKGDKALLNYALKFDKIKLKSLLVSEKEINEAEKNLDSQLKKAIQTAYKNILVFHESQKEPVKIIETTPGVKCWRKSVAIEKVGLYIPGGTAPLFSTLLMLGIPAKIAGCKETIVCTPSDKSGNIHEAILYTAKLIGITKIYKTGGAQAIGAMAYGTKVIPQVYKIFGPGNQYVTCAKQLINMEGIAIDMPAGPSEVAIFADESCDPSFVAADLLSQAEHGSDSQVLLVTASENIITSVNKELEIQLNNLPRKELAKSALKNSKSILVKNTDEGIALINTYAPEHLILACENNEAIAEKVTNAGSVFLGNWSCESAGDYASGTNHTLPTNGYAKAYSGVSLDSFVKKITFQNLSETGLKNLSNTITTMAEAEGLQAHSNAVKIRMKKIS